MIADAIRRIWKEKGYSPKLLTTSEGEAVVMENYRIICDAIDRGMADYMAGNADQGSERTGAIEREVSPELTAALRDNAFIFSGWKAVRTMEEAGLMIVDRDGGILPYEEFERAASDVFRKQGLNLRAEYQHASQVAQMAAHWADIERDGDRYDLQYRTVGDNRVRPEHRDLDGVTLPPSDPFWQSYYPPNGWGCRCSAVQVRRGKYQSTLSSDEAIVIGDKYTEKKGNQIFRTNVGRSRKAFERSTNYPPKGQCQGCDSNLNLKYNPRNANCQACRQLKTLNDKHSLIRQRHKEYDTMKADPQWKDVKFDERTGALSAVHVDHKQSGEKETKVLGDFTGKQLELECLKEVFRMGGHKMLLLGENTRLPNGNEATALDAILDDKYMDIRSITKDNNRTILNGLIYKNKQNKQFYSVTGIESDSVLLYFHEPTMYNPKKISQQIEMFVEYERRYNRTTKIKNVYCVVRGAEDIDLYNVNIP